MQGVPAAGQDQDPRRPRRGQGGAVVQHLIIFRQDEPARDAGLEGPLLIVAIAGAIRRRPSKGLTRIKAGISADLALQ